MRLVRHPSINCGASRSQKQERTSGGSARPVVCTTRRVDAVKHVFECSHIKDSNTCSFCLGFRPGAEGKPGWMDITVITPYRDGPLVVRGPFRMVDQDGAGPAGVSRSLAYLDAQGGRPQGFAGTREDRNARLWLPLR